MFLDQQDVSTVQQQTLAIAVTVSAVCFIALLIISTFCLYKKIKLGQNKQVSKTPDSNSNETSVAFVQAATALSSKDSAVKTDDGESLTVFPHSRLLKLSQEVRKI